MIVMDPSLLRSTDIAAPNTLLDGGTQPAQRRAERLVHRL